MRVKRFGKVLAAVALLVGVSACGSQDGGKGGESAPKGSVSAAERTAKAYEERTGVQVHPVCYGTPERDLGLCTSVAWMPGYEYKADGGEGYVPDGESLIEGELLAAGVDKSEGEWRSALEGYSVEFFRLTDGPLCEEDEPCWVADRMGNGKGAV